MGNLFPSKITMGRNMGRHLKKCRIIYTEARLQKMNKSPNGSCHFCKNPEHLMHLFVNCKLVDSVWTEIFQKINEFYEQIKLKLYQNQKIR